MILLFACSSKEQTITIPKQSRDIKSIETTNTPDSDLVSVATPMVTDETTEVQSCSEVQQLNDIDYTKFENRAYGEPLLYEITIKEINWERLNAGKQYDTTFYNQTVDFQELQFSILEFSSDNSGTSFSISVNLPKEWSNMQCLSINSCFGFRFFLDDIAQNDFMLINQDPIFSETLAKGRCDSFIMTYQSKTVTDTVVQAFHTWKVVPFYYYWVLFSGNKLNDRMGDMIYLEKGDVCRFNGKEEQYQLGQIGIVELPEISLMLPISNNDNTSVAEQSARMLPITVWSEDVEKNEALGYYNDIDCVPFYYGTYQLKEVDFSDVEINIERFYYWNHGLFYVLHKSLPQNWPEDLRKSVRFKIDVYADDELLVDQDRNGRPKSCFVGVDNYWREKNPKDCLPYPSEIYIIHDQKNFSLLKQIPAEKLTFRIYYCYISAVTLRKNGKTYDLSNGEPVYADCWASEQWESIPFAEITISTDSLIFEQKGIK